MKSVAIFIILILSGAIFARSDCNATLKSAFGGILEENNVQLVELMHSFNACPMNWTRIDAACYFIPEERLNYDEARQKCQELSDGARLFEPKTLLQNQLIHTLAATTWGVTERNQRFTLGIHKIDSGNFVYASNGETLAFENWDENEPNNSGGEEKCVNFFWFGSVNGTWNDYPCNINSQFICEKIMK